MKTTHHPFVYITGFFGLGISLNRFALEHFNTLCFLVVVFSIISIRCSRWKFVSTIFLLFAVMVLGMTYTQSRTNVHKSHIMHIAKYYRNHSVAVKGVISSSVQERRAVNGTKTTFTLDVGQIQSKWGWQKKTGKILVNVFQKKDIAYGDYIQIEGKLHRPYNFSPDKNFSYRDYLSHRGIYYLLSVKKDSAIEILDKNRGNYFKRHSLNVRRAFKNVLSRHLSKYESGIMQAILLGDRSTISKPVRKLFVQTGTAHILAISGLHIGVVAGLFLMFIKFMPIARRWQLGCVIILLVSYAYLTGGRPSVVRATIMMVVFLSSLIIEKEPQALNTLFLAAMIILVFNPLNLFDVGFQLSFVCVFSIICLNLRLTKKKFTVFLDKPEEAYNRIFDRVRQFISSSLALSSAIWIGVAGFIAYYFGIITPVTIFANLLIVPLISIIVTLGLGLIIMGMILPSCAMLFAGCLKIVLNMMVGLVFLCDKIPFAYVYIRDVKTWHVMTYYAILLIMICGAWRWQMSKEWILKIVHLGGLVRQVHHMLNSKILSNLTKKRGRRN